MLNKTAAHPILQHDGDLKLFLESESFNVDVKHKEKKEPGIGESKGMFSSLGGAFSVGTGGKFVEQDDVRNYHHKSGWLELMLTFLSSGSMIGESIWTLSRTNLRHCSKQLIP